MDDKFAQQLKELPKGKFKIGDDIRDNTKITEEV